MRLPLRAVTPLLLLASAACASVTLLAPPARAALPPLVPREVLFGELEQDSPEISPDGRWLAWAKRDSGGIVNIWVRRLDGGTAWQVTHDPRGTRNVRWSPDSKRLLYFQDKDGDEINHVFAVEVASGALHDLTPFPGTRAEGLMLDPHHPGEMLVGLNRRDPRVFDLYRIDLATGESRLDTENPGDVVLWLTDRDFQVRGATALRPSDSATLLRVRDDERSPWREIVVWPFERAGPDRAIKLLGFVGHDTLLAQTWAEGNTSRLVTMSARDGRVLATLASDSRCDLWNVYDGASGSMQPQVILSRESGRALAAGFEYLKPEWRALDRSVAGDLAALDRLAAGAVWTPVSTDASGRRWVVLIFGDRDAGRYVMWDRHARKATPLFWSAPALRRFTLAPMKPLMVPARDGLELPCYLTLPANVPARHLPLVLLVHGGPWFRDGWGFQPEVQWLANRGYAVLQVNFRASTGFGVDFVNAGDHQFGTGSVQHDLTDAVRWAIARGIADPGRVGIMGWSFGGYATLCGLAFTPELYACGVDGVGPSRLSTLIESFPSYWGPRKRRWLLRMGDVVADSALDRRISPYFHVDAVRAPLLIGHGANDPRVKLAESEQIVKALRGRGREVRFVVYPDEGHGFGRAENNLDFYGRAEEFLARYLGGRAEPWREVKGATAQVR